MIHLQKINNELVKPVPVPKIEEKKIKGHCVIPEIYANIFLVARKKSGKTSVIWKILKSCSGRNTNIVIFASTLHKDPNLIHIVKYFKNKGNQIETYTSIKDNGVNKLEELLMKLKNEYPEDEDEEEQKPKQKRLILFGDDEDEPKKRKSSKVASDYIIIFDDIGNELRNPLVNQLLKTNRHYKAKVILSSQYVNDLSPESRKQIDYWILFGGHKMEKLKTIYDDADLHIPFELFLELYANATAEKSRFYMLIKLIVHSVKDSICYTKFHDKYIMNHQQKRIKILLQRIQRRRRRRNKVGSE